MGAPARCPLGIITKNNKTVYLIDGWSVDDLYNPKVAKFGILQSDTKKLGDRGQLSSLAQLAGIVLPGLIMARHIFEGLKRPLYADDNMKADTKKLVHSWRPQNDFHWDWSKRFGRPQRLDPEPGSVFVVIVSKNEKHLEEWPEVYAWIDRWNWVYEDPLLPEAPLGWEFRYERKLYSR
jgi:hypothetical protein